MFKSFLYLYGYSVPRFNIQMVHLFKGLLAISLLLLPINICGQEAVGTPLLKLSSLLKESSFKHFLELPGRMGDSQAGGYTFYLFGISFLLMLVVVFFVLLRLSVKANKKLKNKYLEMEKLNATKDKFFSIIAHDLKSPFNSLMGFSEVLSLQVENKSPKEIMAYSRSIYNSTRKLYSLVDTLLQWSRTQLGTTDYNPERLDVKVLALNVVSILKINAEEKDIIISLDIDNKIIAWADKDLFSAVLRNLVSNAIKFSRVGSVIKVAAIRKAGFVEVSVSDTGVGISSDNLDKIFRVDANLSTVGTLNEKGTGLGLALCKEFAEINKGAISVESKLEKGSVFKFTVPESTDYSLN